MIFTLTLNATVDRVLSSPGFAARPAGLHRAELVALIPAGKGFNVSRILSELATRSVAAGLVGRSERGLYADAFASLGVETILASIDAPTRSNVTVLDPESGQEAHLRERGPEVPPDAIDELERSLLPGLQPGDTLVVCGSLPPNFPPERLGGFLATARKRGARLFVDASGPALSAAWELRPDVLSINEEELAELGVQGSGVSSASPCVAKRGLLLCEAALRCVARVAEQGGQELVTATRACLLAPSPWPLAPVVLIKLGPRGALAVSKDAAWRASPPKVEAKNTVGAGDAFNAGFLAREAQGVEKALAFAVACGSAQVESGMLGRLRRGEAERLAARVEVAAI
jgi:tagatose 6-phosphate kinase